MLCMFYGYKKKKMIGCQINTNIKNPLIRNIKLIFKRSFLFMNYIGIQAYNKTMHSRR